MAFISRGMTSSSLAWVSRRSLATSVMPLIVELRHLLHLLGDRLPRLGDIGRRIGGLSFQSGAGSLELQIARPRDQTLLDQRRNALHLLLHRYELCAVGLDLRLPAGDLGFELGDFFLDDVALAGERREPALELMQLPSPDARKVRVIGARLEFLRHHQSRLGAQVRS